MNNGKNGGNGAFLWVKILLAVFLLVFAVAIVKEFVIDNPVENKIWVIIGCAVMGIVGIFFGINAWSDVSRHKAVAKRNMHVNTYRPDEADRARASAQRKSGKKKKKR